MTARLWHSGTLRVSCNNTCHRNRGSLGGEDYATGVGTPAYAPFNGIARYRVAGTGGWTLTLISTEVAGAVTEVMHLSRSNGFVLGGASKRVTKGQLLGYSGGRKGAPGAGSSTGPHMHEHGIIAGVRQGMSTFITAFNKRLPRPAGGTGTLITDDAVLRRRREDIMYVKGQTAANVYAAYTDRDGKLRLRVCGAAETAFANTGKLTITGLDKNLTALGVEAGWAGGKPPVVVPVPTTGTGGTGGGFVDPAAIAAAVDAKVAPRFTAVSALITPLAALLGRVFK